MAESTVVLQRLIRQRLTHFMKIREIFKIKKIVGKNMSKSPIFGQNHQNYGIIFRYIQLSKFKNTNFWTKKCRENQSKIGTTKIDTPEIDTFFKF